MTDTSVPMGHRRPPPIERRTRALDAFIDLVLERGDHPRPEEVAALADVSIASLYRYFTDLDELRNDAAARLVERFPELFIIPQIGIGARHERIASFTASRLELHEALHPLQLLARSMCQQDPSAQAHVDGVRLQFADQTQRHFDPELRQLSPARRENLVAMVAVLTSVESWEQLRRSHERTPAQTKRAWNDAIDELLPATASTS
ncbi:MAG: TetR/AcrR family transcriptional regulator [Ilumatobacteraceae bacterium]|nr:TetR/AcrR family transcriptional regulator [Ilumatobacteraceae bacterium]